MSTYTLTWRLYPGGNEHVEEYHSLADLGIGINSLETWCTMRRFYAGTTATLSYETECDGQPVPVDDLRVAIRGAMRQEAAEMNKGEE